MDKVAKLQMQIKENSNELNDFLQDLTKWEENIKQEDEQLRTTRRIDEKLPPVRKGKKVKPLIEEANNNDKDGEKSKKVKIKSYDYDAWSKFDVDAACAEVENSDEENADEDEEDDDEEFDRIQEERKTQQAAMEKDKGNQLFKEGKYEAAINRYTTAINLHPTNPIFYANRGMALLKMERYGAAEQDCTFALELDPSYVKALLRRATARTKLKKFHNAKEDFLYVLKEEPENKQALTEMKNIEQHLLQEKKASKTSTKQEGKEKKKIAPRKKRSTKPLKRIFIQQIGSSDEDGDEERKNGDIKKSKEIEKIKLKKTKEERVPALHQPEVQMKTTEMDVVPVVPTSSFMFENQFKKLNTLGNQELLYSYFKMIPCDQYTKLFRQCIDSIIASFFEILHNYYIRDKLPVHEELETFSQVERFSMATMFLSSKDKKAITDILAYIDSTDYPCKVMEQTKLDILKKYG